MPLIGSKLSFALICYVLNIIMMPMSLDIFSIMLKWDSGSTNLETEDPYNFMYETRGEIFYIDESEKETLLGKFCLYYADIDNASDEGFDPLEVLDTYTHTFEYCRSIYMPNGSEFNEKLLSLLNYDIIGNNLLILDRLEILPKYRGQNLGLIIMRRLIQRFSLGAGVVAIKPFPLQFEHEPSIDEERQWLSEMQLSIFSKNERLAIHKLRRYYSRLGFVGMQGTPFMFRATAWRLPTIEELCT